MELPEAVRDEITSLEKRIGLLRNLAPAYLATCDAAKAAGLTDFGLPGVYGSCGIPYVDLHARVYNYRQVGTFGKTLRKYGFRLRSQRDVGTIKVVDYTGPITLFLTFGSGASCQYVKVGEKMEPVYKLKCEEKPE